MKESAKLNLLKAFRMMGRQRLTNDEQKRLKRAEIREAMERQRKRNQKAVQAKLV